MTTPANPDDLITWLRAQLNDDVETFDMLDSTALNGIESTAGRDVREYVERGRAEVDAKRRILDEHPPIPEPYGLAGHCERCVDPEAGGPDPAAVYPCTTVRLLALPYADRPGYRDDWRP